MNDLISRQAAIDELYKMLHDCFWADDEELDAVITTLNELPSVQPQQTCEYWDSESKFCALCRPSVQPEIIRCKDCKHWRDSDGVYRRGVNAESKCPLNTKEVYAGTFYCGYAERRTDG